MKLFYPALFVITIPFLFSCTSAEKKKEGSKAYDADIPDSGSIKNKTFSTDWKALTKDYMTWYNYTYYNIILSRDFIGLDMDSQRIDKPAFLNKLMTENVVAYKTRISEGIPVYQLYKLNSPDEDIKATSKQMASIEWEHFKMEGTEIPDFSFKDMNGRVYTKVNTKGKIVVLKCWFIHCVACVKEFPELNNLVDEYRDNSDVLFISLATDSQKDLSAFFQTKLLKYATIPEAKGYMSDKLKITQYPTHLLVDRNGKIKKVVNTIEELKPFLQKEVN